MNRLAARVLVLALSGLAAALVVVGVGTGVLLHFRALQALDEALLAAAAAEAHPEAGERWRPEHLVTPVEVHRWAPGDPLVPAGVATLAFQDEQPRWMEADGRRILLLTAEPTDAPIGPDGASVHPHTLLVASAPEVTLSASLGPFVVAYGTVAMLTAAVLGGLLILGLRRALRPLEEAAAELDGLGGKTLDARLAVDGPEEVRRVLDATNGLLERLETAAEGQSRFVADAAHELRTPVTALVGELDLSLRHPREAEEYRSYLERARSHAERMRALVEALLAMARVDAGQAQAHREREHLSALALAALSSERETLKQAGCTVQVQIDDDPEVEVQAVLCRVAIGTVLRNIAMHAPGSTATLRVARCEGRPAVVISDDGPGVEDERTDDLLQRFARGTSRGPGLGLGLPLALEVMRRHGGTLELGRAQAGGLEVRLILGL